MPESTLAGGGPGRCHRRYPAGEASRAGQIGGSRLQGPDGLESRPWRSPCPVWSVGVDPLVAHQRAQDTFAQVLANVTADQMSAPTPCPEWDVQALIDHVIGGNQRVVERAGGQVAPLSGDLGAAHRASAKAAQETFAEPEGLLRIYRLPIGEIPGTAFIQLRTSDLLAHAWDLATATGQPTDLDPELADYVLSFSDQMMSHPGLRGVGRPYGEEQPCGDERPAADRVAAFLGRKLD